MSETVFRSIFRRSASKSILEIPGQLLPGQAAFADDTNELLYRKRMNASVGGGEIVEYLPASKTRDPYDHIQSTPTTVWAVNHGQGTRSPNVIIYDSAGRLVLADVAIIDQNNLTITFSNALSGRARIS